MKKNKYIIFSLIFVLSFFTLSPVFAQIAAVEGSVDPLFNPNYIISDREMIDNAAMGLDEVKSFLKFKQGTLANYEIIDPLTGFNKSAAEIIYEAAQNYKINPKVLLVLLQKEQSLVENLTPSQYNFDWATGYARCDSCGPFDPLALKYKGFFKQVDGAAGALRFYLDASDQNWLKKAGIIYNIDSIPIIPANQATAGLYTYTPHFQGNYNFWKIWRRWFSQKFPDGLIVKTKDDDIIYLIKDGKINPFKNKAVFLSRFSAKNITLVEQKDIDSYLKGPEIKFLNYSLVKTESDKIYLLVDSLKRQIDKAAMRYYGFYSDEVQNGKEENLAIYYEGEPVSVKTKYPLGVLMRDIKTGEYFLVVDSVKHPIYDKNIITVNFSSKKLRKVGARTLAAYKNGEPIIFQDGTWLKTKEAPEIYLISNGMRRWIKDEATFSTLNGQFQNVIITNEKTLALHPLGEPISLETSDSSLTLK